MKRSAKPATTPAANPAATAAAAPATTPATTTATTEARTAAPEPASTPGTDPAAAPRPEPAADGEDREARIRRAAYERYQQRNGQPGDETADWLAAEAELDRTDPHPAVWAP